MGSVTGKKKHGRCHHAALEWDGTAKVVPYIAFDVTKLVLSELVKDPVRNVMSSLIHLSVSTLCIRMSLAIWEPM